MFLLPKKSFSDLFFIILKLSLLETKKNYRRLKHWEIFINNFFLLSVDFSMFCTKLLYSLEFSASNKTLVNNNMKFKVNFQYMFQQTKEVIDWVKTTQRT